MVNQCSATSSRPKLVAYEMKGMIKMPIRKVEIERFSVTSSKSFEAVVAALEAAVGHPDISEFGKAIKDAGPPLNWKVRFRKDWAGRG